MLVTQSLDTQALSTDLVPENVLIFCLSSFIKNHLAVVSRW